MSVIKYSSCSVLNIINQRPVNTLQLTSLRVILCKNLSYINVNEINCLGISFILLIQRRQDITEHQQLVMISDL